MMDECKRCDAVIYRRDTYRVSRSGGRHFKMHYQRDQCSRPAVEGSDLCWQHHASDGYVARWSDRGGVWRRVLPD